jgi:alkaline phosphatase
VAMSTYSVAWGYDPALAWTDFSWNLLNPTDSAAAATSMATGVKTYDAGIGVDAAGNPVESVTERATSLGKSTGVISTVPFSHATPAGFAAHDVERDNYHAITDDILASDIDVVMGAGHPRYNNDHKRLKTPAYTYLSESAFSSLTGGATPFTYIDTRAQFEELAAAADPPDRVFGIAQVSSTLQERRTGDWFLPPYALALNDVPNLPTMTRGALNVLDDDPEGLFLMVEGGAIDWAGHRNQPGREIEETIDFFDAVDVVIDWVNTTSSWRDTLVIVTGDHETGGLSGPGSNPAWTPLVGESGEVPAHSWHSINHTNVLLPVFAQGAGAKELGWRVAATDPVRGTYLDNTDVANVLLTNLWGDGPGASDGNGQGLHLKG